MRVRNLLGVCPPIPPRHTYTHRAVFFTVRPEACLRLGYGTAPRPLRCFQHNVELGQVMPTRIHIGGLRRPSYGWGGTIAPVGIAPEGVPHCNCISMLSAGPRRRPESHEAYAYISLGPPQWTWQSPAALRKKSSAFSAWYLSSPDTFQLVA